MQDFIHKLVEKIENKEEFTMNEKALVELDIQSIENYVESLENKIETLEYSSQDYYQTDKDDLDVIVTNVMRKMFYPQEDYVKTNEEDYDDFIDDFTEIIKMELDKVNLNKV